MTCAATPEGLRVRVVPSTKTQASQSAGGKAFTELTGPSTAATWGISPERRAWLKKTRPTPVRAANTDRRFLVSEGLRSKR
jgi:hypothetical protein